MKFGQLLSYADRLSLPHSLQKLRKIGLNGLIVGINSVLPHNLIKKWISLDSESFSIGEDKIPIHQCKNILIIGGGKATAQMAESLVDILNQNNSITYNGIINIPYGQDISPLKSPKNPSQIEVNFCAHPVPDENGLKGVKKMMSLIEESSNQTIIIVLVSGGGSSLMPLPADGLSLEDLKKMNQLLLESGATINEVNCVRKHISKFKGGQLSNSSYPRKIFSLIISDVIGDDLQTIASGPTSPDHSIFQEAVSICKNYGIWDKLPDSVKNRFTKGESGIIEETPKPDKKSFETTKNYIIGSALTSSESVRRYYKNEGVKATIFTNNMSGEASNYGKTLYSKIKNCHLETQDPLIFIGTGEFTVTIKGNGKGGRNQEMLLSFLNEFVNDKNSNEKHEYVIISAAFDGIEGNSPAMGAIIDSQTCKKIKNDAKEGLNIQKHLENNDSYDYFNKINDSLITGQTGTNVNDMLMIILNKK